MAGIILWNLWGSALVALVSSRVSSRLRSNGEISLFTQVKGQITREMGTNPAYVFIKTFKPVTPALRWSQISAVRTN
jgi:hypothetical protein